MDSTYATYLWQKYEEPSLHPRPRRREAPEGDALEHATMMSRPYRRRPGAVRPGRPRLSLVPQERLLGQSVSDEEYAAQLEQLEEQKDTQFWVTGDIVVDAPDKASRLETLTSLVATLAVRYERPSFAVIEVTKPILPKGRPPVGGSRPQRVLDALRDHRDQPMTISAIRAAASFEPNISIPRSLDHLHKRGLVERVARGVWRSIPPVPIPTSLPAPMRRKYRLADYVVVGFWDDASHESIDWIAHHAEALGALAMRRLITSEEHALNTHHVRPNCPMHGERWFMSPWHALHPLGERADQYPDDPWMAFEEWAAAAYFDKSPPDTALSAILPKARQRIRACAQRGEVCIDGDLHRGGGGRVALALAAMGLRPPSLP